MKSIKNLIEQIVDYLSTFDSFFTGVGVPCLSYPQSYGEATDLVHYLALGLETEENSKEERRRAAATS